MENLPKRIVYIDNIRTVLIGMVILVHVSVTYGPVGFWYYYERTGLPSTYILGFFSSFCQAFLIGILFMISAYFILPSYRKKGAGRFINDRLKRLGIPLLFYILFIGPLLLYIHKISVTGERSGFFIFYHGSVIKNMILETGPLWFVQVLLLFTFTFALMLEIIRRIKKTESIYRKRDLKFPENYKLWIFILVLSTTTFLVRLKWPIGTAVGNLQISFSPQYIFMFVAGIFVYKYKWLEKINRQKAMLWSAVSVISVLAWPVIIYCSKAFPAADITILAGGLHWQAFLYGLWESILCVGMTITIIYFFREKLDYQNRFLRYLSESSYAAFLIHPLIIVPLSFSLVTFELHPLIKFLIVICTGVPLSFMAGIMLKRIFPLKKIL
jgi:glucans biosynthesis protein C